MKKHILIFAVSLIRLAYKPMKLLGVRNKITLISRQSDDSPADFILIKDYLRQNRPDVLVRTLCRKLDTKSFKVLAYPAHMLRQMYHIATSKVIVLDGYCIAASVLSHKKENIIVQIWHASAAIKKFGWQIVGKPGCTTKEVATLLKMHANYNYVIASSRLTGAVYLEAFNVKADQLRYYGLPHLAGLHLEDQNIIDEIREAYHIDSSKKTVLYVPTFRNGQQVNVSELANSINFDEYNLIVKAHPIDKLPPLHSRLICANRYPTLTWMKLADVIITDYSSLIVEAALLHKPLYLYVYDIDEYARETGLNMNYNSAEIRPIVFREAASLIKQIEEPYQEGILESIISNYIEVKPQDCLQRFGEFIETLLDGDCSSEKKD